MDQMLLMGMQLCEEFAQKSRQMTLTEDEALTYFQCLSAIRKQMRLIELKIDQQIASEEPKLRRFPYNKEIREETN